MAIGAGWTDGAWVDAGWVYGAWDQSASAVVACSSATGTLLDEFTPNGLQSNTSPLGDTLLGHAQSFRTVNGGDLTGVCVRYRQSSAVGTFNVSLYAHSGTYGSGGIPTGSALVTSAAYDASTLSTASPGEFYWFPLTYTLAADTPYVIVVDGSGITSGIMSLTYNQSEIPGAGGNFSFSSNGTTWAGSAEGADFPFKVYYTPETTAPVLSSPTDAATAGATSGVGTVDTDEGNGTLYYVVTTSLTGPSVAQVQAGQDNLGAAAADSGSQAVIATGTQNVSASGLTAETTYYIHYQHADALGNDSTVASADGFTTPAAVVNEANSTRVSLGTTLSL